MRIQLSPEEVEFAAMIAVRRQVNNIFKGREHAHGNTGRDRWKISIEGACAEMAVAKATKLFYSGCIEDFGAADVLKLQVRSTPREDGSLIVRLNDKDDDVFILVSGQAPEFVIPGWIYGRHAKLKEYWTSMGTDRPSAWFVPQHALTKDIRMVPVGAIYS